MTRLQIGGFTVTEGVHPSGTGLPWHHHDGPTICFVLDGGFTEGYRGRAMDCTPGLLKITPAGERHYNRFDRGDARGLMVEIEPNRADTLRPYASVLDETTHTRGGLPASLALRVRQELHAAGNTAPLAVEGLLLELIASVGRARQPAAADQAPRWLEQAREIIHARVAEGVSLTELAEAVGAHPVTLTRAFHRAFGCTAGEYLRRVRLERALHWLANTDRPLVRIALESGFVDHSHFSNFFRRRVGVSPSTYRRNFRQGQAS
jgi:AraC family transcriptional regulator